MKIMQELRDYANAKNMEAEKTLAVGRSPRQRSSSNRSEISHGNKRKRSQRSPPINGAQNIVTAIRENRLPVELVVGISTHKALPILVSGDDLDLPPPVFVKFEPPQFYLG